MSIRVGIGGWTFEPWRNNFFPAGLPHSQELHFASRAVTAIEINGTYYSTQSPKSFARWHDETPEDFVFSLKANRFATNRRVLADAGESITRFVESGLSELGKKLGPIVWQFAPTKQFDPQDFEAFLALLPKAVDGRALRHVLDVRHASFMVPAYLALARRYGCATVFADSDKYPSFADVTGDFVYARLMRSQAGCTTGYETGTLDRWADVARDWAKGTTPQGAPLVEPAQDSGQPREVFMFFINGAKERAPAAAQALIARL
ncbi:DUF72 domain-containing protein [Pseudorhodoferax sp.]|uniref:DUF72 domain-containing protein n=1 Tax=Pseudorhodoferax sp. TaxID=1993553 RepID=UPI002DD65663|nr:DUF72 domain-containing protein [Pseudorhodoferax sp.]